MTNLLLLNNFYPVISLPTSSKERESDELLYTALVTRYGPQSIASTIGQPLALE